MSPYGDPAHQGSGHVHADPGDGHLGLDQAFTSAGPAGPAAHAGWEAPPPRKGFFTDTSICIGCKACEVACKEWNGVPQDGIYELLGSSYDNTGALGASTWRHVEFIEQRKPLGHQDAGITIGVPETVLGPDVSLMEMVEATRRDGVIRQEDLELRRRRGVALVRDPERHAGVSALGRALAVDRHVGGRGTGDGEDTEHRRAEAHQRQARGGAGTDHGGNPSRKPSRSS